MILQVTLLHIILVVMLNLTGHLLFQVNMVVILISYWVIQVKKILRKWEYLVGLKEM
jgi:antibiotic biosynthesis monooxygenase (ABM) superfamily enzyme